MNGEARATANEIEICDGHRRQRRCPGCGGCIDLAGYGCIGKAGVVVCVQCGDETPLVGLELG